MLVGQVIGVKKQHAFYSYVKLACHQHRSRVKPHQNFVRFFAYTPNFVPRPLWEILTYAMCTPWHSGGSRCSQGIFTGLKHREFCATFVLFYGYYTNKPALAGPSVTNFRISLEQRFTGSMAWPTDAVGLWRSK